jgi:hypothetical protein
MDRFLNITEFARAYGFDRRTVTKAIKLGQLPTLPFGNRVLIDVEGLPFYLTRKRLNADAPRLPDLVVPVPADTPEPSGA